MKNKFNLEEQKAIKEKVKLLKRYVDGKSSLKELAKKITKRRLKWFKENKNLLQKYKNLPAHHKAHRMLFYEHMGVDLANSKVENITKRKIRITSNTFCPYLEACKLLKLDTKKICKAIGEPTCSEFIKEISPALKFYRDYSKIRPHHTHCVEFIEVIE